MIPENDNRQFGLPNNMIHLVNNNLTTKKTFKQTPCPLLHFNKRNEKTKMRLGLNE